MTTPEPTEVEAAHNCVTCGEPATNGVGPEPIRWYCWLHDDNGEVPPIRAAWPRAASSPD